MVKVSSVSTVATIISVLGWFLYQSVHKKRGQPYEVPYVCNEEKDHDVGDCSEGDNVHGSEDSNNDPILEPKHKIFLSHSGAQKEFVEHLCKALEDRWYYPFFDRRHESLPKGDRFPELIVQAAEQCEMLIVVVSNEYFMSKWPMIELSAFVKAHKLHHGSKNGLKILPLFYGLSVSDLENEGMQKKWFQEWKTLAEVDPKKRIVVSDWKNALNVLKSFNGLPYDKNLKEVVAYEEKIVSYVCKSIAPDIKWDDSHVQGKSSICKVIGEKIEGIGVSRKYQVKVLGIYGVGGIGKTTACKTLCNELSSKYEGRACHIEFSSVPSSDSKELFQKVLRDLIRKSMEVIQQLNEGECKDILLKNLFKQRTFLAIDNILDNHLSIKQAKTFLEAPYHMDSLVVVTARSQSVLRLLGLGGDACLEMPDLGEVDAVNLFLHHAANGKQFLEAEDKRNIMTCVRRCYFSKGNGEGHHYHPLALQALGLQLGCHGENPCDWVMKLPQVRTFNYFSSGNPVFDILRSSFDLLSSKDQTLFMDVGCFSKLICSSEPPLRIEWLCFAHKQDEEEITCRLEHLKRKGLLQHMDLESRRISMHDLYVEFAKLEAKGSFSESTNSRDQMWMYIQNGDLSELERRPEGGCWHKLMRLSIIQCFWNREKLGRIGSLEGTKWDYFSNVEVLQLWGLRGGRGALNLEGLMSLTILELLDVSEIDRVEGLEKLKHLTYFKWISYSLHSSNGMGAHIVGQLPSSLKQLLIWKVEVVLGSDVLIRCHYLSKLRLYGVEAHSLDLSNCWSLERVYLGRIWKLQTLLGLSANRPSNLQSLEIYDCEDLVDITGIDSLHSNDGSGAHSGGQLPSSLKQLIISGVRLVLGLDVLARCHNLSKLKLSSVEARSLDLSNCWSLESVNFRDIRKLQTLLGLDANRSSNLQSLEVYGCKDLVDTPGIDSSHSNNGLDAHSVGQLPSSLKRLIIWRVRLVLGSDVLARCHNLSKVELSGVVAHSLDLSNCWSLERVSLGRIWKLQTLSGLGVNRPSTLQSLQVYDCKNLVDIPGIDQLIGLKILNIRACPKCEVPSLCVLTELQVLSISDEQRLMVSAKDCFPRQLRELRWCLSRSNEGLKLNGFNQLEVLDLSRSDGLTSLAELRDLPTLQRLNLHDCKHLLLLPDLSMSRNLQELDLGGCSSLELHEKDIQMLSKLPFLQPVAFSGEGENEKFWLDLVQGKVLVRADIWKEQEEWEKRDLGAPPIKIGRRGTWE